MSSAKNEIIVHVIVPAKKLAESQQLRSLPSNPTPAQMALWTITTVQSGGSLAEEVMADPIKVLRSQGAVLPPDLRIQILRNDARVTHTVFAVKEQAAPRSQELSDEDLEAVAGGKHTSQKTANEIGTGILAGIDLIGEGAG